MRGKTVAILETRLGPQMAELLERRGAVVLRAPALAELPDLDPAYIKSLIEDLRPRPARLYVFQTGVGTQALFKATDALGLTADLLAMLQAGTVAVRGPKPTGALKGRQVRIDLAAVEPFTTVELLQAVAAVPLSGARVIVQRYGVTNAELDDALRAKGAEIIEIPVYRWSLPDDTSPLVAMMDALDRGAVHAVALTNAAQVYNLFALAERFGRASTLRDALNRVLIASVGPVASGALKKFGVAVGVEAHPPKLGPLVEALDNALSH
jgi:uroporphyrinogen-III synthase